MTQPTTLPQLAREAVRLGLRKERVSVPDELESEFAQPAGAFVTIRTDNGALRGCVGSTHATQPTVADEVARVAPLAALEDPRFPPVDESELAALRFEVSVLTPLEPIAHAGELDAHRYGVQVQDSDGRRALLLPSIPGIDSVDRQLYEVRRKAGIQEGAPIQMWRFEVEKYGE